MKTAVHDITGSEAHLDSFSVEPDIPVCQLVNEADQLRHNSVQTICWDEIYIQSKTNVPNKTFATTNYVFSKFDPP